MFIISGDRRGPGMGMSGDGENPQNGVKGSDNLNPIFSRLFDPKSTR